MKTVTITTAGEDPLFADELYENDEIDSLELPFASEETMTLAFEDMKYLMNK